MSVDPPCRNFFSISVYDEWWVMLVALRFCNKSCSWRCELSFAKRIVQIGSIDSAPEEQSWKTQILIQIQKENVNGLASICRPSPLQVASCANNSERSAHWLYIFCALKFGSQKVTNLDLDPEWISVHVNSSLSDLAPHRVLHVWKFQKYLSSSLGGTTKRSERKNKIIIITK